MFKEILACMAFMAVPLMSQTTQHKSDASAQNKGSQSPTGDLNDRLKALETRVAKLETSVAIYKYMIDEKQTKQDTVQLDASSRGYQRLDTEDSTFLISLDDASKYLDGYRITLDIGNPSNAKYSNAKVTVRWGRAIKSTDSYDEWQKSTHQKEVALTEDLVPGAWNTVTVDLVPCASDELGYLEVSMETPSVILHKQ
jgi:hypothetical protein